MKFHLLFLALIIASFGFARPLDTSAKAERVQESLSEIVASYPGFGGIGIGACNPKTGKQSLKGDFVHCVVIYTSTEEAFEHFSKLYPVGTQIRKVFIAIENVGEIFPQPNGSGGN